MGMNGTMPTGWPSLKAARTLLALLLPLATAGGSAQAQVPRPAGDPSLDPLSPRAGEFLDTDLAALRRKAEVALAAGDPRSAAAAYLALLQRDIRDPDALYALAGCYGRMGDAPKAAKFLVKAVEAGLEDAGRARRDPAFDRVRDKAPFALALDAAEARGRALDLGRGEVVWVEAAARFPFLVKAPGAPGEGALPVVIALHGYASRPESMTALWDAVPGARFVMAAPQAPYLVAGGRRAAFSWTPAGPGVTPEEEGRGWTAAEGRVAAAAREAARRHGAGKVFLMGFSQGAGLALSVAVRNPALAAGVLCFGGRFPAERLDRAAAERAGGLRVLVAHGTRDAVVPPAEGERMWSALKGRGCDATLLWFDGGHEITGEAWRAALEWMGALPAGGPPPSGLQ
jgi:phospholipase/carboxylesterase